jgi:hypothetical protein
MSFAASRLVCTAALGWSPAAETIEQVVLGLGRRAAPFMQQLAAPPDDRDVLVIEVDGKCPPTATAAELAKRRGPRRHGAGCPCGCQRHRGRARREARGGGSRRKKGDKSENGKEVMLVMMYTLSGVTTAPPPRQSVAHGETGWQKNELARYRHARQDDHGS